MEAVEADSEEADAVVEVAKSWKLRALSRKSPSVICRFVTVAAQRTRRTWTSLLVMVNCRTAFQYVGAAKLVAARLLVHGVSLTKCQRHRTPLQQILTLLVFRSKARC